jgi:hypothetical protein
LLTAVLADRTGTKVRLAEGAGESSTYDLAAGTAKLARHLVWLMLAAEAYAVDERIGPMCGAGADHRRASLVWVGLDISS